MTSRSPLFAILTLAVVASAASADPFYRINVTGTFTAGGTLRDFTNKGFAADTIDLTGLPVSLSFTYDLGAAPPDVFTATDPNTNNIRSTSVPFFVTGQADISNVVNQLQALGNPADLPVPKILQLTPLPGGTSSNIDQALLFTQFAAGADAVIADTVAISQNNSPVANVFLGWDAGVLASSVNRALPLGNYAVEGYPSFTYNFLTPGTSGNAILGVTGSNLSFTANAFTTQFVISGLNGTANIALSTVSGGLVTPEPGTGIMVTAALLAIGAILLGRRRQLANCMSRQPGCSIVDYRLFVDAIARGISVPWGGTEDQWVLEGIFFRDLNLVLRFPVILNTHSQRECPQGAKGKCLNKPLNKHRFLRSSAAFLAGTLFGLPACAATIQNFAIINSSSLSNGGGVFSDGSTYSGSFTLDTSQITQGNVEFPLTSFDVFTTGAFNMEFNTAKGGSALFVAAAINDPLFGAEQLAQLQLTENSPVTGQPIQLILSLLEPSGTFHGGLVLNAHEFGLVGVGANISDASGSALIIDPALLAPEPGSGLLALAGASLIACSRMRSRRTRSVLTLKDQNRKVAFQAALQKELSSALRP